MHGTSNSRSFLPLWKFFSLVLFTGGAYVFRWMYQAWQFVDEVNGVRTGLLRSIVRTTVSLFPVSGIFYTWRLFSAIRILSEENDLPKRFSPVSLFLLYHGLIVVDAILILIEFGNLPGAGVERVFKLLRIVALLLAPMYFLIPVQQTINDYWHSLDETVARQGRLRPADSVVILLGSAIWGLMTFGCLVGWSRIIPMSFVALSPGREPIPEGANPTDAAPEVGSSAHATQQQAAVLLNNEGVVALEKKDFKTAIGKFQESLERMPGYAFATRNLSVAYNNYALSLPPDQALIYLNKALALDPDNPKTAENLKVLRESIRAKAQLDKKKERD
jgi:tetratricopeptide (TPR) repeat protein